MASSKLSTLATVDGQQINCPNLGRAVETALSYAREGRAFTLFTLNLDHLVKLRRSAQFRAAYEAADIVTADGAPVAWLARGADASIERATGADLLLPLVDAAAAQGLPVFLFGSSAGVMGSASRRLSERTQDALAIAGTLAPSPNFDPEGDEADRAITQIRASGARLVFVALGAPKQEIFSAYARSKGLSCGFVCVGASLDFIAGAQVRAPAFMRDNGLEWLWRLGTNPRRLARRYAECGGLFLTLLASAPLRHLAARARGA